MPCPNTCRAVVYAPYVDCASRPRPQVRPDPQGCHRPSLPQSGHTRLMLVGEMRAMVCGTCACRRASARSHALWSSCNSLIGSSSRISNCGHSTTRCCELSPHFGLTLPAAARTSLTASTSRLVVGELYSGGRADHGRLVLRPASGAAGRRAVLVPTVPPTAVRGLGCGAPAAGVLLGDAWVGAAELFKRWAVPRTHRSLFGVRSAAWRRQHGHGGPGPYSHTAP